MTKPRKRKPALTLKDLAPETAKLSPEQIRNRLSMPSLYLDHLEEVLSKIDAGLTPKEREVVNMRWDNAAKKLPDPEASKAPSVLGSFIGSVFGKTGTVIGAVVEWTADAFKRLDADLQRTRVERDEARADAVAMYEAFMQSMPPAQDVLERVARYPRPIKDAAKR